MAGLRWAARSSGGIAVLALTLTATACGMGGADGSGAGGNDGAHLVYAENFGPAAAWAPETDDAHPLIRAGCLETLVRYSADRELEPGLATEWSQTEPTTWEFTLREGVSFQNGTPMDAEAVAGALTHLLEVESPARSFNPEVVSGVEVVGDATIRITTPSADPLVPLRVAAPNTGILAPEAYAGRQIDIQGTCTGPFEVTGEVPRQSLSLERNENYWGGDVSLATAEVRFVVDGATRTTQLQTGEVQIARSLPPNKVSVVDDDANLTVQDFEVARSTMLLLNNSQPPFDDPLVRRAMQYAVDRSAIVDTIYEGVGQPAAGPFSPETEWAPDGAEPVPHDPDEARSLLAEAGVDPESLSIELIAYNDQPAFADIAAVIQDQLGQIGVDVRIRGGEYASVEPDLLSGDFDAALLSRGYLVDVADPGGFLLSDWSCEGSYNIAHHCDEQTDQLIQDAVRIEDVEERNARYAEIAERLQSEAASVFLAHEGATYGTSDSVENFEPHPLDYYVLTAELALSS